jgi:flavodoxin
MKIAIILYSLTGNTLSVCEQLQSELTARGHAVSLERISTLGDSRQDPNPAIDRVPDPQPFDALVIAAPVHGFMLAPGMRVCLEQITPLEGKTIACLTTHFFPFAWMGGKQVIGQMGKLIAAKGGRVAGSAIINWSRKNRVRQIEQAVSKLAGIFGISEN